MSGFYLTLFVSLVLGTGGVVGFVFLVLQRDHDHADRLSLLPLEDDTASAPVPQPSPATPGGASDVR